ncbi:hypothetical protein TetV_549 [Tetraselmis virus 1]|uniref:Uncharacterized protein n=1 Tax=Tetraselmis virus 1 TaxID=2060617 RepID=A0A2P0VP15_9VIRU|nr:hypothetical protein QJ968_gp505 [Tetraselmis virus 1]AUF82631.1 hypothetical protein TetV_549 [Tetraselmis virus 1]
MSEQQSIDAYLAIVYDSLSKHQDNRALVALHNLVIQCGDPNLSHSLLKINASKLDLQNQHATSLAQPIEQSVNNDAPDSHHSDILGNLNIGDFENLFLSLEENNHPSLKRDLDAVPQNDSKKPKKSKVKTITKSEYLDTTSRYRNTAIEFYKIFNSQPCTKQQLMEFLMTRKNVVQHTSIEKLFKPPSKHLESIFQMDEHNSTIFIRPEWVASIKDYTAC